MKNVILSSLDLSKTNLINLIPWFRDIPENEGILLHL